MTNTLRLALADRLEKAKREHEPMTRTLAMHLRLARARHQYSYDTSIPQLHIGERSELNKRTRKYERTRWWFTPLVSGEYSCLDDLIAALRDPNKE